MKWRLEYFVSPGDYKIHARLLVKRIDGWSVGGMIMLYRSEWDALLALLGPEVELEKAFPAEVQKP